VEGLAELVGNITLTCSGGTGNINTFLFVEVNATITNRLDVNGNPTNISVTGATSYSPPVLSASNALFFTSVQLPGAGATLTISGIRAAVPSITGGVGTPDVEALVSATQLSLPGSPVVIGISAPTLLSSVLNYGVPCLGSPSPANPNFANLVAAGTAYSTIRVTEASVGAFTPKNAGADFGLRFLVNLSGYGPNAQVYVPDVIAGNRDAIPTSAGGFNTAPSGGTYSSGSLLLTRVDGADSTGNSGTLFAGLPAAGTSFSSVSQVNMVNGAGFVTYEVLDANPNLLNSAQIPVFVAVPASSCSTAVENTLAAAIAPASNVGVPTQTDPIPRYIATPPPSDCTAIGDCAAAYFPLLTVAPTSITMNGSSLGSTQIAFLTVGNGGSSQFTFSVSTQYLPQGGQSVANWLSINGTTTNGTVTGLVDPAGGVNSVVLTLSASPAALPIPSTYYAYVTINAGSAGTSTLLVEFNVSPAGPVLQGVVNAANFQTGAITAGSFAAIYGLNLSPETAQQPTVTFNTFPAEIVYDGATQVNVLVPMEVVNAASAGVTVTIDGVVSNTFPVNLVANAPAVFNPGILNQDNSVNSASAPASLNDIVQIFLTGLATPVTVPVTVSIGGLSFTGPQLIYVGPVPSVPGLEQVNVQVPNTLIFTGNSAPLSICVPAPPLQPLCSAPVSLYLH
jgi:uncharacterized protein (TIGR03437 family)